MKFQYVSLLLALLCVGSALAAELAPGIAEKSVERGYEEPCCTEYCYWEEICITPTPTPTPTYYYYYYARNAKQENVERSVEKSISSAEKSDAVRGYFPTYYYYETPTYYYYYETPTYYYYYETPTYYYYYETPSPTPTPTPYCTYTQMCKSICSICPTPYYYSYEG
ncbi:hypothetical protein GAYE_SCF39G5364 [Galdieria yellowstonensis]|uniref:Uncharacterized protein n=1 Tax=Galdieria yellowstonensis TaxID=3028027 RepID=A0AAV9IJ37_9RHOD|nr:hypothetical protein GAYE_SCF39G5364 [Galdieria yellowstonensis]